MPQLPRADDDGGADRLPNTPDQPGAARRNLLVAGVLIASGALLRFATLLYLDTLLAVWYFWSVRGRGTIHR